MKFINNDPNLPNSWRDYFNEINDEADDVIKEINGPSWRPGPKQILNQDKQKFYVRKRTLFTWNIIK